MTPETRAAIDDLEYCVTNAEEGQVTAVTVDTAKLRTLLGTVEQFDTAVERTVARMREYGSGSVNVRQVINLLSPTWPDGNYAQAAPLTDEPSGSEP